MTISLERLLAGWITGQRWFAGKGRAIDTLTIDNLTEIRSGDPGLLHLIASVAQGSRRTCYQILLGVREELPDRLKHVLIGTCDANDLRGPGSPGGRTTPPTRDGSRAGAGSGTGGGRRHVYDAAHDASLTTLLLQRMASGTRVGPISFHHAPGVAIDTSLRSLVLTAEQSNTSLIFGDRCILKLFRQVSPGLNPELEVVTALAAAGSSNIAKPYGWIDTELDGQPTTLAIMQEYLANANEGWAMALTSVRDLYACPPGMPAGDAGGDFAAEAFRLGRATAHVHRELAAAFPTGTVEPPEIKRMAESLRRRLDEAIVEVPQLAAHADVALAAYDRLADVDHAVPVQRVHGDFHLGQVMRTPGDWIILDFEGEPGQPLVERRGLDSPLRDVAGMLRSFEYAARHLLADHPSPESLFGRAREWAARNRAAFLSGYTSAFTQADHTHADQPPAGHAAPGDAIGSVIGNGIGSETGGSTGEIRGDDAILLRALELGKAVYEVVYEARNRPTWLPIPLAAFS